VVFKYQSASSAQRSVSSYGEKLKIMGRYHETLSEY